MIAVIPTGSEADAGTNQEGRAFLTCARAIAVRIDELDASAQAVDAKAMISFEIAFELAADSPALKALTTRIVFGPVTGEYTARLEKLIQHPDPAPIEPVALTPYGDGEVGLVFEYANCRYYHERANNSFDQVRVSGKKELTAQKAIAGIHQLEIEVGAFERTIPLPAAVQVDEVTSSYNNGILIITLPKKRKRGKVCITISAGEK